MGPRLRQRLRLCAQSARPLRAQGPSRTAARWRTPCSAAQRPKLPSSRHSTRGSRPTARRSVSRPRSSRCSLRTETKSLRPPAPASRWPPLLPPQSSSSSARTCSSSSSTTGSARLSARRHSHWRQACRSRSRRSSACCSQAKSISLATSDSEPCGRCSSSPSTRAQRSRTSSRCSRPP
eukprot:Amastigsp_a842624_17.p2 type:complete len:179 gc:universal Amastigsp_a842624_17:1-537(+)